MIEVALSYICSEFNQFFKNKQHNDENRVILNRLVDSNGAAPEANQNKLVISLINVEKDASQPNVFGGQRQQAGSSTMVAATDGFYNVDVLISANFDAYSEALKFLDWANLFLLQNPVWNIKNHPGMPGGLHRLQLEPQKATYQDLQSVWAAQDARYMPSVIYTVKGISLQSAHADSHIFGAPEAIGDMGS